MTHNYIVDASAGDYFVKARDSRHAEELARAERDYNAQTERPLPSSPPPRPLYGSVLSDTRTFDPTPRVYGRGW